MSFGSWIDITDPRNNVNRAAGGIYTGVDFVAGGLLPDFGATGTTHSALGVAAGTITAATLGTIGAAGGLISSWGGNPQPDPGFYYQQAYRAGSWDGGGFQSGTDWYAGQGYKPPGVSDIPFVGPLVDLAAQLPQTFKDVVEIPKAILSNLPLVLLGAAALMFHKKAPGGIRRARATYSAARGR